MARALDDGRFRRPSINRSILILVGLLVLGVLAFAWFDDTKDEATRAAVSAGSFYAADDHYFDGMDNGVQLSADEVKGRNMWLVWSGGNDRFWDVHGQARLRHLRSAEDDLLGTRTAVQPRQSLEHFGVINEPCFDKPTADPSQFRSLARPAASRLPTRSVC